MNKDILDELEEIRIAAADDPKLRLDVLKVKLSLMKIKGFEAPSTNSESDFGADEMQEILTNGFVSEGAPDKDGSSGDIGFLEKS